MTDNDLNKPFLMNDPKDIEEWDSLDISDKKVLAVQFWDLLSDDQRSEFAAHEYITMQKNSERKKKDLVSDPVKMKAHFLYQAAPLMDQMIEAALGSKKLESNNDYAVSQVWEVLRDIIKGANNPAPLLDLKGKSIEAQIDQILTKVSAGEIDFDQAKEYMSLVSTGFNIQKLPELSSKLEQIEAM